MNGIDLDPATVSAIDQLAAAAKQPTEDIVELYRSMCTEIDAATCVAMVALFVKEYIVPVVGETNAEAAMCAMIGALARRVVEAAQ
jgi:hypothetical protein